MLLVHASVTARAVASMLAAVTMLIWSPGIRRTETSAQNWFQPSSLGMLSLSHSGSAEPTELRVRGSMPAERPLSPHRRTEISCDGANRRTFCAGAIDSETTKAMKARQNCLGAAASQSPARDPRGLPAIAFLSCAAENAGEDRLVDLACDMCGNSVGIGIIEVPAQRHR